MNKHTKGPWDWKDDMGLVIGPSYDPSGFPVAEVIGHPGEAFANAQLIACAPELLDALMNLSNYLDRGKDPVLDVLLAQAESVLTKATRSLSC
jgi:hypothetical protein